MSNLEKLKAQADELGVKYHHMAGEAKIKEAIDAHLAEQNEDIPTSPLGKTIVPMTSEEFRKKNLAENTRKIGRLVRCRITCMNPAKREWEGEIISVGSAKHGTFKKYVPFDGREYHLPQIIFDALKERKCTIFHTVKDARGQKIRKGRLIDEFAIEVLPPLSRQELDDLKKQQALANA